MNQPFLWVEEVFEQGSWQLNLLFQWLVPRAAKRFVADKKRASRLLDEKLAEEEELEKKTLKKEKENAKFWAKLRLCRGTEMAKHATDLRKGLTSVRTARAALTAAKIRYAGMEYLKLQRNFLLLDGVDLKALPTLTRKVPGGKKTVKLTPDEFLKELGPIFDAFTAGQLALNPVPVLARRITQIVTFRKGTMMPELAALLAKENVKLSATVKEVEQELKREKKARDTLLQEQLEKQREKKEKKEMRAKEKKNKPLKKKNSKKKKKGKEKQRRGKGEELEEEEDEKEWIGKGVAVWVWDVDNLDELNRSCVFAAKVLHLEDEPEDTQNDYWKLKFEGGKRWRYPTYRIFSSGALAKLDMEAELDFSAFQH
jgi:hypothetical protein